MEIHRDNGYSASVEGILVIGEARFALAKTNDRELYLAESCEAPPNAEAEMLIIIDGTTDSQRVTLPDGVALGQSRVRYEVAGPH